MNKQIIGIMVLSLCALTACGTQPQTEAEPVTEAETVTEVETATATRTTTKAETAIQTTTATELVTEPEVQYEVQYEIQSEPPEIFLIERTGYGGSTAPGYPRSETVFIDVSGAVYYFNNSESYEAPEFFETIDAIHRYTEPVMQLDSETTEKLCSLGESVNPESWTEEKIISVSDSGNVHLFFKNPETGELTEFYEKVTGTQGSFDDDDAREFLSLYHEKYQEIKSHQPAECEIFRENNVPFLSIEAESRISGRFFLENQEEVEMLAEKSGVPVDEIISYTDSNLYYYSDYVYLAEMNFPHAEAMIHYLEDNALTFLHDSDGTVCCNIIAVGSGFAEDYAENIEWKRISD